jgi:protein arginine kinase activator
MATENHCPRCGTAYEEVQTTHLVGCSACYDYFSDLGGRMEALLKQIHGKYTNRETPYRSELRSLSEEQLRTELQIQELEREMKRLTVEERYEEAIEYRDQIETLRAKRRKKP